MAELARSLPAPFRTAHRPGLLAAVLRLDARFRQRRALERLDDRALRDLGLDARDVARETGTMPWDAPLWWR